MTLVPTVNVRHLARDGWRAAGVASLTGRELQIARRIVEREKNGEIAGELFPSKKTIKTQIGNMFRKLDASSGWTSRP